MPHSKFLSSYHLTVTPASFLVVFKRTVCLVPPEQRRYRRIDKSVLLTGRGAESSKHLILSRDASPIKSAHVDVKTLKHSRWRLNYSSTLWRDYQVESVSVQISPTLCERLEFGGPSWTENMNDRNTTFWSFPWLNISWMLFGCLEYDSD